MAARTTRARLLASLLAWLLVACGAAPGARLDDFELGMSRAAVVERFGEPARRQTLVKTQPQIWGPIESFWDGVAMGARVELWSYPVEGGAAELYFVNGSTEVQGKGFADARAVYEPGETREAAGSAGAQEAAMSGQETFLIELSDRLVPLLWEEPAPRLSAAERVFIVIWQLEAEINNGGFAQYYDNSAGDRAGEAPAALVAIGAHHTAEIVRSANALFAGGPPADRDARGRALEAIAEAALEELDTAFLAYEDDLSTLLYTYVQQHRDQIRDA